MAHTFQRTGDFLILLNSKYLLTPLKMYDAIDNTSSDEESTDRDGMDKNRLASYKQGWPLDFLTPQQMAKAGFYYLKQKDNVRCNYCLLTLGNWIHSDDPIRRHQELSPRCQFVCGYFDRETIFQPHLIDYISSAYLMKDNLYQMPKIRHTLGILMDKKIINIANIKGSMKFAHYGKRLDSFQTLILPQNPSAESLAEAGFYYAGFFDKVYCFFCSIGLDKWNENDDPWEQHALNSPECDYLLLKKGGHFVKNVWKLLNTTISVLMPSENDNEGDSSLEDGIASSTEGKLVNLEKKDDNNGKISLFREHLHLYQERDPNTLPDFMICKLCYLKEINVCIVPCGHAFACVDCALAIPSCAMCSQPMFCVTKVSIYLDEKKRENNLLHLPKDSDTNAQFPNGLPKDSDDVSQLVNGLKNDSDDVAQMPNGLQKDSDDVAQFPNGLPKDSDDVDQLPSDLQTDSDDVAQMPGGLQKDSDDVAQLPSDSQKDSDNDAQFPNGLPNDSDDVVQLANGLKNDSDDVAQMPSGLKKNSDDVAQLTSDSQTDSDNVAQLPSDLQTDSDDVAQMPGGLQKDSDDVAQLPSDLQTDSDYVTKFPSGSSNDSDNVAQMPSGLQKDSDDVSQFPNGLPKDSDNVAQLPSDLKTDSDDVAQMSGGLQKDSDDVAQLPSDSQKDSDNDAQCPNSFPKDSDDVAQLTHGLKNVSDDVAQMPSGLPKDSDDVAQLPSGSKKDSDDIAQFPSGSPNDLNKINSDCSSKNESNCKCCGKKEMKAIFIPCRHIYACQECAIKFNECPACLNPICAYIKVYMS